MSSTNSRQMNDLKIAFLGFGEAASAIVEGWLGDEQFGDLPHLEAFDIARNDPLRNDALAQRFAANKVIDRVTASDAVSGANVVFSLVTADQTLAAARSAIGSISKGTLYFDCNSCAPETKREAAALIGSTGARYIDLAILSPIYPQRHKSPMLICGTSSDEASDILTRLHMNAAIIEGDVGKASTIKMMRSVMIKGMEALMAECAVASRKAGVSEYVFASLDRSYPGIDWLAKCTYNLERMMVHGSRRAAEMREVALTVEQLGLENPMTRATVGWQQTIGDLNLDPGPADFNQRADSILSQIDKGAKITTDRRDFEKSKGELKWA